MQTKTTARSAEYKNTAAKAVTGKTKTKTSKTVKKFIARGTAAREGAAAIADTPKFVFEVTTSSRVVLRVEASSMDEAFKIEDDSQSPWVTGHTSPSLAAAFPRVSTPPPVAPARASLPAQPSAYPPPPGQAERLAAAKARLIAAAAACSPTPPAK
jgi:hypothetical protein